MYKGRKAKKEYLKGHRGNKRVDPPSFGQALESLWRFMERKIVNWFRDRAKKRVVKK